MKKHYLHLSVHRCDTCQGPVVTGSLAVRENEISKETEKRGIGAICLSCGDRQRRSDRSGACPPFDADGMGAGDASKHSLLITAPVEASTRRAKQRERSTLELSFLAQTPPLKSENVLLNHLRIETKPSVVSFVNGGS